MADRPEWKPNTEPRPPKPPPWPHKVLISGTYFHENPICETSQTTLAKHAVTGQEFLFARQCKRWCCPICSRAKISRLAYLVTGAQPTRLVTLTIDPAKHGSERDAFEETSPKCAELFRRLRERFGKIEYLRVTEVTKAGWPHYHHLVRSGFLPQPLIKAIWNKMTGASIVDVRQVHSSFNSYMYLTKYLSKMHHLGWTDRHVSYSKSFFREPVNPAKEDSAYINIRREFSHPHHFLSINYAGQEVLQVSPSAWLLSGLEIDLAERAYRQYQETTAQNAPDEHTPATNQTDFGFTDADPQFRPHPSISPVAPTPSIPG